MFLLLLTLPIIGCPDDEPCEPLATQCNGEDVEICNADERWELIVDCKEFGPLWVCIDIPADGAGRRTARVVKRWRNERT
jgi:hypothetical protein